MDEDKFPAIDDEMEILQEQYDLEEDFRIKKILKSILVLSPLILSIIAGMILNNHLIVIIGICVAGGEVVVGETFKIFSELIKYIKDTKDDSKKLDDSDKVSAEDFYTDEYKNYYARTNTVQNRKYEEALRKQKEEKSKIHVYSEKKELSKEDSMYKIVMGLDVYTKVYKLPPINVSNEEWDRLFDEMYAIYDESFGVSFYIIMLKLVKFTLAAALLDKIEEININTFIDNIQNVIDVDDDYIAKLKKSIKTHQVQKIIKFPAVR